MEVFSNRVPTLEWRSGGDKMEDYHGLILKPPALLSLAEKKAVQWSLGKRLGLNSGIVLLLAIQTADISIAS